MTEHTDLGVIEAALKAATPGPWENATPNADSGETVGEFMVNTCSDANAPASNLQTVWAPQDPRPGVIVVAYTGDGPTSSQNAHLIANAPAWLAELVERVKAAEGERDALKERPQRTEAQIKAEALREAAAESAWARKTVEDELIELRDARIALVGRANGLVVAEFDGTPSNIIRLGFEMAWSRCCKLLADRIEAEA